MSTFTWIDYSERQRRQMLEAIDMFRDKDTRDELGISGIRDTFSDMLFPGTGALQTRARYFFFIPWMYRAFEVARVPSSEIARKVRSFEIALIDRLAEADDHAGTIGIEARATLQRVPSSIYWNGLKMLGIRQFPGSQAEYQRNIDRQLAAGSPSRNDDGEVYGPTTRAWHGLPAAPASFPGKASFVLTVPEARYLSGRVIENHRHSLFAFMLDRGYVDADAPFAWEHPGAQGLPDALQRHMSHAQCISEVMNGAAILYNLYLAELDPRRDQVISDCTDLFEDWAVLIGKRSRELSTWDRTDFWKLLLEREYVPSAATRMFVDEWCRRALSGDLQALRAAPGTRDLIFGREAQIKGALARSSNRQARGMWRGDAGLGRLDFRWSSARVILRDIAAALAGDHA